MAPRVPARGSARALGCGRGAIASVASHEPGRLQRGALAPVGNGLAERDVVGVDLYLVVERRQDDLLGATP